MTKYRMNNRDEEVLESLKKADDNIKQAYERLKDFMALINDKNLWEGNKQKAYYDILLIAEKVHQDLIKVSEGNIKEIEKGYGNAYEFMDNHIFIKNMEVK